MKLKDRTVKAIIDLQRDYPEKRSALLPALHLAQEDAGFLPPEVQAEVAALFDIEPSEVRAIVCFYDMFHEERVGKHILHICKNASCMLRGSDCVLKKICEKLNVEPFGTTADGEFTVIPSECLAACDRAPMMLMDDKIVGPIKEEEIDRILKDAKLSPGHPSPIKLDEAYHG